MEEKGIVIEVNDKMAKVEVQSISCEKCDHFRICNPSGGKKVIELENTVNAVTGNRVKISIENAVFSRVALLVYGVPVLGLIIGYLIGERIAGSELAGVFTGTGLLIVVYVFLAQYDKRVFGKKEVLKSRIVEVVRGDTDSPR